LIAPTLASFEAQSLRSHPLYFFIQCLNFPFELSVLRLRIAAAHFFEGFLDGELVDFSHLPISLEDETRQLVVSLVASHSALVLAGFARLHLDEAASLGEGWIETASSRDRAIVPGEFSGFRDESREFC
jgi:hypothetical protein